MDTATLSASGNLWANSDGGTWSDSDRILTLAPSASWSAGFATLNLDIDDATGNPISTFTVMYNVDDTSATATPSPASGSGLYDDEDISVVFSESMDTDSINMSGSLDSDIGTTNWSQTTVSNDTLTLQPTGKWTSGAQTLDISVDDLVGNNTLSNLSYTVIVTTDSDGDGYSSSVDCDDNDSAVNPGATEICDGIDNNCANGVDETCTCIHGTTQSCYSGPGGTDGIGICATGIQTCSSGAWGSCVGEQTPINEIPPLCSNGLDDDCDGLTDISDTGC